MPYTLSRHHRSSSIEITQKRLRGTEQEKRENGRAGASERGRMEDKFSWQERGARTQPISISICLSSNIIVRPIKCAHNLHHVNGLMCAAQWRVRTFECVWFLLFRFWFWTANSIGSRIPSFHLVRNFIPLEKYVNYYYCCYEFLFVHSSGFECGRTHACRSIRQRVPIGTEKKQLYNIFFLFEDVENVCYNLAIFIWSIPLVRSVAY